MWDLSQIAAIAGSGLGSSVLTAVISGHYNRKTNDATAKKTEADAKTDLAASTLKWAEVLAHRIDSLETKLDVLQKENIELKISMVGIQTELRMYKEGKITYTLPTPLVTTPPA